LYFVVSAAGVAEPLTVARLSEEHGFLALDGRRLPIGARVLVFPNHSCPVANLVDELMVLDDGGRVERWRVAARGAIR
jgi:D-serine deaminase-like pyridoxal phosphate-dependent protein